MRDVGSLEPLLVQPHFADIHMVRRLVLRNDHEASTIAQTDLGPCDRRAIGQADRTPAREPLRRGGAFLGIFL